MKKNIIISDKMESKNKLFAKNINNNYKLIPFNTKENYVGFMKYFPASSKEWRNKVYFYNLNKNKNFPVYDINIYKLINSYFNLYFKNTIFINKYISRKSKRLSLRNIYISKPNMEHTNSKVIITIYTYNKENLLFVNKIKRFVVQILIRMSKIFLKKNIYKNITYNTFYKTLKITFYKILILIRKYKLRYSFNKYKFEDIFLYKLGKLFSKFYNKKIEFKIVNLRSIILNSDILTEFLRLKLKRKRIHVWSAMNFILNKANFYNINVDKRINKLIKSIDYGLLENKYLNLNINSMVKKNNLSEILRKSYKNIIFNKEYLFYDFIFEKKKYNFNSQNILINSIKNFIRNKIIFNSIRYKNIRGIKLEVRGRLTKRYRADRALFNVRINGGLDNIDSSFKGFSTVIFRGYTNSNVEYSLSTSKRRIGSFAIKGWISGK